DEGRALRTAAETLSVAARANDLAGAPWTDLLEASEAAGERAGAEVRARAAEREAEEAEQSGPAARKRARDAEESARRRARGARTATLDLGLGLVAAWLRDIAAIADGAAETVFNVDRTGELAAAANGIDARRARRGAELAMETRRRLTVNVNETLALEALAYRLEYVLSR
ncbi:MAG TPA: hypothetical protein VHF58_06225, partial [Solirubrobacterales bacterium]|nr:hypothetical protein [Solirubrobacterales bacterium]